MAEKRSMIKTKRGYAQRRIWSKMQTKKLLELICNRKNDFHRHERRKIFLNQLVVDLTSSGVSEKPFTLDEIRNKIKTLKSAYKIVIDSNNRSGAAPYIAPYIDLMDEIYSYTTEQPESTNSLAHSIGIGRAGPHVDIKHESIINISLPEVDQIDSYISSFADPLTSNSEPKQRIKMSKKEHLLDKKFKFKEKMAKTKEESRLKLMLEVQKRKDERLAIKQQWHEEKRQWHNELVNILAKKRNV